MPEIQHRLGDIAFLVKNDGRVIRTAVSTISLSDFNFLADSGNSQVFWDVEAAIEAATKIISTRVTSDDITIRERRVLTQLLSMLSTKQYRLEVSELSLQTQAKLHGLIPGEDLRQDPQFPSNYFLPGQQVFGLVTPRSRNIFVQRWQPWPYFIHQIEIKEVSYAPRFPGSLSYSFSLTNYNFTADRLFATEAEARSAMVDLFAQETRGTILPENIPLHSAAEEHEAFDALRSQLFADEGTRRVEA